MKDLFIWFWTTMIFISVAWYAYLLFHVGIRGGYDILKMARALRRQDPQSGDQQGEPRR